MGVLLPPGWAKDDDCVACGGILTPEHVFTACDLEYEVELRTARVESVDLARWMAW